MLKSIAFIGLIVVIFASGCKEEPVGAPCVAETDDRKFSTELLADGTKADTITWSIETGSVQCATSSGICLTQTKLNPDRDNGETSSSSAVSRADLCLETPSAENCGAIIEDGQVIEEPVLLKFSFCSCRCEDEDGNRYVDNPDKYDDLCECPPSAHCVKVLDPITGISDKLFGGYCVPECIDEPCESSGASNEDFGEICTPSTNSEEPWLWSCKTITR
ncbi:MAG: hypothetical protein JXX29_11455 [Deltaproteobacteria bacterium]|nr:hypothetical protein [Deltaproteobacteria bacterium]